MVPDDHDDPESALELSRNLGVGVLGRRRLERVVRALGQAVPQRDDHPVALALRLPWRRGDGDACFLLLGHGDFKESPLTSSSAAVWTVKRAGLLDAFRFPRPCQMFGETPSPRAEDIRLSRCGKFNRCDF